MATAADTGQAPKNGTLRASGEQRRSGNPLKWYGWIGAAFFLFSLIQLQLDYSRIMPGIAKFAKTAGLMFPPDASQWKHVLLAAVESIQVAILGTVIGIVVAFFLAFLAADNIAPNRAVSWFIRSFASLLRAIPTLIWALIFIVAVGMGPLPGVLAIMVHAVGGLIKVFSQSLEEVDGSLKRCAQRGQAGCRSCCKAYCHARYPRCSHGASCASKETWPNPRYWERLAQAGSDSSCRMRCAATILTRRYSLGSLSS
ncbi:ABC-type phosphate/phosphonate transport system permease subunit [Paenibacillus harenae]|nr:ABC-type phosphate/phosphonate transport system permease subunit [Paenibacillus harenae]